jgi:hypothetical protein
MLAAGALAGHCSLRLHMMALLGTHGDQATSEPLGSALWSIREAFE